MSTTVAIDDELDKRLEALARRFEVAYPYHAHRHPNPPEPSA